MNKEGMDRDFYLGRDEKYAYFLMPTDIPLTYEVMMVPLNNPSEITFASKEGGEKKRIWIGKKKKIFRDCLEELRKSSSSWVDGSMSQEDIDWTEELLKRAFAEFF